MGWLKERISTAFAQRQVLEAAETQSQRVKIEAERLHRQEETLRLKATKQRIREFQRQLGSIGAESLLEEVRKTVWRGGRIKYYAWHHPPYFPDIYQVAEGNLVDGYPVEGWEICLEHGYTYRTRDSNYFIRRGFLALGVLELGEKEVLAKQREEAEWKVAVKASLKTEREPQYYRGASRQDRDFYAGLPAGRYFVLRTEEHYSTRDGNNGIELIVPFDDASATDKIKTFLAKDCERRILERRLPFDFLSARSQE